MQESILRKLEALVERHQEVEQLLSQPDVIADQDKFRELNREYSQLQVTVTTYKEYTTAVSDLEEMELMLNGDDEDMKAMAEEEIGPTREKTEHLEHELQLLLLPHDKRDDCNCFLEIRAGTGGDEAALFAGDLFKMYTHYVESKGWQLEVISVAEGEMGGYKEIIAKMSGEGAYGYMKFESGGHRVQRVPVTETQGRVHTSACTVMVLPEIPPAEAPVINQSDLRIDTFRASGAGGQHINKTSSAIRITHLPTGIVVQCQNERSQLQNKDKAMKMLKAKLYLKRKQEEEEKRDGIRGEVMENGFGSQIRSYVMQPYTLVKDLRTSMEVGNIQSVMDGNLDPFISAYLKWIKTGNKA